MSSVSPMPAVTVSVAAARDRVLAGLRRLGSERVDLGEALGRVLAEDVVALDDLPGGDNSAMDGYAVAAADLRGAAASAPVVLPVAGEARAGSAMVTHARGTATVIATGALLPEGADAVVPVEMTARCAGGVEFRATPAAAGQHVRRRGDDVWAGTPLLRAGARLRPVDVGVCASAGVGSVTVARRPRVAVLTTGDELVVPGERPRPHQVTDVNGAMLAAAVREAGGIPAVAAAVPDEREAVAGALRTASADADLIVSSAGVSMGEHDHVRQCVADLGRVDLWTVAMRPGRPLVVGSVAGTPFLGLPGNPVSSAVTFLLFARPAILALQGASTLLPVSFPVVLADDFDKPAHLETYVRVRLRTAGGRIEASSSGGQGSAMMHALAAADALAVLAAGASAFPAGTVVPAMLLP